MNAYLTRINDFIRRLDPAAAAELQRISTGKIFKKGDYLLRQGEVCRKSYLVEQGIARKYYLNDGKEITTELYFDSDIAVSFDSYCLQRPSREFIHALTDVTVSQIDFTAFLKAKQQFPCLTELDLMITEYHSMMLEEKLFQLHTLNATGRYHKLVQDHPQIIRNISLTYIASYLGISLETLSRIRSRG